MPLVRPTYTAISASLYTDLATGLGTVPIARFSILGSLSRALSRALDSIYGYVDGTYLDAVPWSARSTAQDAWASLWGCTRMAPAAATGSASFVITGVATIPAGSSFVGTNTVAYTSTADVAALGTGTQTVVVPLITATTGSVTNMVPGAGITLTTVIPNVASAGIVLSMTGGIDAETDQSLFARAQERRSNPPQGGAQGDYVAWAMASGAVTRAWCAPSPKIPGAVIVYIMLDGNANGGFPTGSDGTSKRDSRSTTKATGDQATTVEYIYQSYLRPVTAFVTVVAPTPTPINITLSNTNPSITTDAQFTGAILVAGSTTLTVTGTVIGGIAPGQLLTGAGVLQGTSIVSQITSTATAGASGSTGTYRLNIAHPIVSSTAMTGTAASPQYVALLSALYNRLLAIGTPLGTPYTTPVVGANLYESDLTQAIQSVLTNYNMTAPNTTTVIPVGCLPTLGAVYSS